MLRTPHELTPGELKCLEDHNRETAGQPVRKNLIKLVRHINMLNPLPGPEFLEGGRDNVIPETGTAACAMSRNKKVLGGQQFSLKEIGAVEKAS